MSSIEDQARESIAAGRGVLGIEFGSTRIKTCLIGDDPSSVLATGVHDWENQLVDGLWSYPLGAVWTGLQAAYANLVTQVRHRFGVTPARLHAIGVSAMMHGYLACDEHGELLVPFRTWRNTNTEAAATELTALFGMNIPQRWSIAHLHQAVRDGEAHVPAVASLTTLAGYVHERLTGRRVLGVGDASGMFPVDSSTRDYDETLVSAYDRLVAGTALRRRLRDLLPDVLVAGQSAGQLTRQGAALIDPAGDLEPGAVLCPPEGDAGTGMVATNAVTPRTGNVSVGTSVFAMVVLERPLSDVHHEIDLVTTPAGDAVAMVHCNNGASELAAWAQIFTRFAAVTGTPLEPDAVFDALLREALTGDADAGGLLAYNYLAGEPITNTTGGRPLFVRAPDSRFTLANTIRAHLYGLFGTFAIGMRVLAGEGVELHRMSAHGGLFRTAGVAQRLLAGVLDAPVSVSDTAGEGGAWGAAVLAAYSAADNRGDLDAFLRDRVFGGANDRTILPDPADVAGFAAYFDRYELGLDLERAALDAVPGVPAITATRHAVGRTLP